MDINRERPSITIYDAEQKVLGMFTSRSEAIRAADSLAPAGANRYWGEWWNPKKNVFEKGFMEGEVWWDGGKPDQHGGHTKGELLSPLFPDDALQWRLMGAPARSQARFWSRGGNEENED